MRHKVMFALLMICPALVVAPTGLAENALIPNAGELHDDFFLPELDSLCRVGEKLPQGCQAISEREVVDSSVSPWKAIGRVNFGSTQISQYCTGTLLSERIVLTASHCLYNFPRKSWIPTQSIRFVAGYQRGAGEAVSEVTRYVLDPVQDIRSRDFRARQSQDWALLVLKDPIGRETGFLTPHLMDPSELEGATFTLAGYAALRPHVLSIANDCGTSEYSADHKIILQKCSAMLGDSGAPILASVNGKKAVVGVFSGAVSSQSKYLSVSIPMSNLETALMLELER